MREEGESEAELGAVVRANENDLEARLKLANVLIASNRAAEGMDQLLEIVRRDRGFRDDIWTQDPARCVQPAGRPGRTGSRPTGASWRLC